MGAGGLSSVRRGGPGPRPGQHRRSGSVIRGIVLLVVVALATVGCEPATEQAEGVLTHVDSGGLDKVEAFTLRTGDGRTIDFTIGVLENGAEFPPSHLAEHLAGAEPIRVYYRREGSSNVAFRIEDASAGASS